MPELPEVETVRRQLEAAVCGKRITSLAAPGSRVARRGRLDRSAAEGSSVTAVLRAGKFLILALETGTALGVHLGMSGRLLLAGPGSPTEPHTTLRLLFDDGSSVALVDPRTFGEAWISKRLEEPPYLGEIAGLGVDLLAAEEAVAAALVRAASSRRSVKAVLLDQGVVAGLGNMYADEVLFRVGIHPETPASPVLAGLAGEIARSARAVVEQALAARGTTFRDRGYRDLHGNLGTNLRQLFVYQRDGLPCYLCRTPVVRSRFQGRHSHWCPACQEGPAWS